MVVICFKLIYECVSVVLRACMKVAKGKRFAFRRNSVSVVIKASSVSPLLLSCVFALDSGPVSYYYSVKLCDIASASEM